MDKMSTELSRRTGELKKEYIYQSGYHYLQLPVLDDPTEHISTFISAVSESAPGGVLRHLISEDKKA